MSNLFFSSNEKLVVYIVDLGRLLNHVKFYVLIFSPVLFIFSQNFLAQQ